MFAQERADRLFDKPTDRVGWLWEVRGNGLQTKSYLFGTCHGDEHNFTYEEVFGISGLQDALTAVKAILFEGGMNTNISNTEFDKEELAKLGKWLIKPGPKWMMPEGAYYKPLFDSVAHFNEVNKFLTYEMKDPEYWKKTPTYWYTRMSFYMMLNLQHKIKTVDEVLQEEAQRRGLEQGYVEEMQQVVGSLSSVIMDTSAIDTLTMKEQASKLYHLIHFTNDDENEFKKYLKKFTAVYLENDTIKMSELLSQEPEFNSEELGFTNEQRGEALEKVENILKNDRNEAWLPVIIENISERPCLIAVGLKHLMGDKGLIFLLRQQGYSVEPI